MSEIYPQNPEPNFQEIPLGESGNSIGGNIVSGGGGSIVNGGDLRSNNFVKNKSGWQITSDGKIFATDLDLGSRYITVDPGENIQTAIDVVSSGGGIVVINPGTHKVNYDIVIPSGVYLQGVNRTTSIIDFSLNANSIIVQGSGNYSAGTVTVSNNGTTVEGSGTSWLTNAVAGQSIVLGGAWYPIVAVTDNTHVTIAVPYAGSPLSGASYMIAAVVKDVIIENITVKNSATSAIKWTYVDKCQLINLEVQTSALGIDFDYVSNSTLSVVNLTANNAGFDFANTHYFTFFSGGDLDSQTGNGMTLNTVTNSKIDSIFIQNAAGDGINVTLCDKIIFNGCVSNENGGQGVEFVSGNTACVFLGGGSENNTSDGVKLTATSDRCFIETSSLKGNGGYGVNIAASTCDQNIIVGNIFDTNTSGTISDSGTSTIISGNVPGSANSKGSDYQLFTSNGTWTKSSGAGANSTVLVQIWGGGGAGGAGIGAAGTSAGGGGGGGGGSYMERIYRASELTDTVTVTVGAAVNGGSGTGGAGNNSTFGSYLTSYGGGGGGKGQHSATDGWGGGGGGAGNRAKGTAGADGVGTTGAGGEGGRILGGGVGVSSNFGGGGGATRVTANDPGESTYGGGGGGPGSQNTQSTGYSVYGGGGGGGGSLAGSTGATSIFGGAGGNGGSSPTAGTAPGGGGGGGYAPTTGTTNGGGGARGEVRVTTIF